MAKRLQLRRGTTAEHSTFTGAVGEVTVDTDKDTVVVHDGSTDGGIPMARADKLSGFKNYIINGGFDVWQRSTNFTTTGYTADRTFVYLSEVSANCVAYRSDDVPVGSGLKHSMIVFRDVVSDSPLYRQKIEDFATKIVNTKTYTMSFWAKTTAGNTLVVHSNLGDTHSVTHTITDTWTRYTNTVPVGQNFTYDAFDIDGYSGIGDFYVTGVQLEEGSVATPFEQRPYGLELSLCQRYYLQDYVTIIEAIDYELYCFPSTMRTQPTVELPVDWTVENDASTNWHRLKRNTGGYGGTVKIDAELSYVY